MAQLPVFKVVLAGFFSQLLCLGIARFAYTPLIPLMSSSGLSEELAGLLAAVNYLGYFSGAILAIRIQSWHIKFYAYRLGLVLAIGSTWLMGVTEHLWVWAFSRYLAGLSSAASMLLASGLILQHLRVQGRRAELGAHFAGLGLGIALVAALVEVFNQAQLAWQTQWIYFALLGFLLAGPAWRWLPAPKVQKMTLASTSSQPLEKSVRAGLYWMYFCAGYGYAVTITFIVSMASLDPRLTASSNWAFLLLGLGAAPAAVVWDRVARVLGYLASLRLSVLLNACTIVLPALWPQPWVLLLSAALFGASFIGCVSLMLTFVGRLYPDKPAQLMGKMTLFYGSAQILAPALSGFLAKQSTSFHSSLYVAAAIALLGGVIVSVLIARNKKHTFIL